MKEIGQFLKQTRESLNISLEEVSVSTKISIKLLQALEEGDVEKLPAKTFVRGFIQSYAKYLGLDVKEVMTKFQDTMGPTNPNSPIALPETTDVEKNLPGSGRSIIKVAAIILTLIGIFVVHRIIVIREEEMKSGEINVITGSDTPLNIKPAVTPSPNVDAQSSPSPNEKTAAAAGNSSPAAQASPQASASPSPKASASPSPSPSPSASPKASPKPSASPKASPQAVASPVAVAAASPVAEVPQQVIVEALDAVTITVTIDSKPSQEIKMTADQIMTFKAKGKIKISTPNGGAISVIQNGFDWGVPGNLGQPKVMVFPK